jgi:hypothetical protein
MLDSLWRDLSSMNTMGIKLTVMCMGSLHFKVTQVKYFTKNDKVNANVNA